MAKFDARQREDHLNAVEIVRDFVRAMNSTSVGFQHVFANEGQGGTLILHVGGQGNSEADMLSVLRGRLEDVLASMPQPEVPEPKVAKPEVVEPAKPVPQPEVVETKVKASGKQKQAG